jgi:hypothetical protein
VKKFMKRAVASLPLIIWRLLSSAKRRNWLLCFGLFRLTLMSAAAAAAAATDDVVTPPISRGLAN